MRDDSPLKKFFPIAVDVEKGQVYKWCGCGESKTPPLCDRDDCGAKCVEYKATLTEMVSFCNCKQTLNPPFCDGSHAEVVLEYLKNQKK